MTAANIEKSLTEEQAANLLCRLGEEFDLYPANEDCWRERIFRSFGRSMYATLMGRAVLIDDLAYDVPETAHILKVSERTIRRYASDGTLRKIEAMDDLVRFTGRTIRQFLHGVA